MATRGAKTVDGPGTVSAARAEHDVAESSQLGVPEQLLLSRLSADRAADAGSRARLADRRPAANATQALPSFAQYSSRRRPSALVADVAGARAMFTLVLAARGVIEIIDTVSHPWDRLMETFLLAVLALGFFAAAPRSHDHRSGWLLSGAAASGLAIAGLDGFVGAAITPSLPVTASVVCIVLLLFVSRGAARHRSRH
jgi:hypothetical protein